MSSTILFPSPAPPKGKTTFLFFVFVFSENEQGVHKGILPNSSIWLSSVAISDCQPQGLSLLFVWENKAVGVAQSEY